MNGSVVKESGGLVDVIDRILDKGLVLNADISVSVGVRSSLELKSQLLLHPLKLRQSTGLNSLQEPISMLRSGRKVLKRMQTALNAETEEKKSF